MRINLDGTGGKLSFTEADVFTTVIPLSEAATATVGPTTQDTHQVAPQDVDQRLVELTEFCSMPRSKREMMDYLGLTDSKNIREMMNYLGFTDSKNFRERYLVLLLEAGKIEMTIPDKPNRRNQKYKKVNLEVKN